MNANGFIRRENDDNGYTAAILYAASMHGGCKPTSFIGMAEALRHLDKFLSF